MSVKLTYVDLLEACRAGQKVLNVSVGNTGKSCEYLKVVYSIEKDGKTISSGDKFKFTEQDPLIIQRVRVEETVAPEGKSIKYKANIKQSTNPEYTELLDFLNEQWLDSIPALTQEIQNKIYSVDPTSKKLAYGDCNTLVCRQFKVAPKGSAKTAPKTETKVLEDPQSSIIIDTNIDKFTFIKTRRDKMKSKFFVENISADGSTKKSALPISTRHPNTPDHVITGGTKYWGEVTSNGSNYTQSYGFRLKLSFGWGYVVLGEGEEDEFSAHESEETDEFIGTSSKKEQIVEDDELPQSKTQRRPAVNTRAPPKVEEYEEEELPRQPIKKQTQQVKPQQAKPKQAVPRYEEDNYEEDNYEEQEEPVKPKVQPKARQQQQVKPKPTPRKQQEEQYEEEQEEQYEEEQEELPKRRTRSRM